MPDREQVVKGIMAAIEAIVKQYSKESGKSEAGKAAVGVMKYVVPGAKAFMNELSEGERVDPNDLDSLAPDAEECEDCEDEDKPKPQVRQGVESLDEPPSEEAVSSEEDTRL